MRGNWKPWIDSPGTFVLKGDSEQTGFLGFWARLTHSGSLLPWWSAGSPACKTRSCATPSWRCLMCLGSVLFNFLFCYCGCILNLFAWFCLASFGASQKICIPDGVMCGNGLLYSVHKRSPPHSDPPSLFLNISHVPTPSPASFSIWMALWSVELNSLLWLCLLTRPREDWTPYPWDSSPLVC